jgi:hypothetical protein
MVQPIGALPFLVEYCFYSIAALEQRLHLGDALAALHVHVRDLMVRHGERLGRAGVEHVASQLGARLDQTRFP